MENVTLMELVDEVRDLPLTVSAVLAQVISECDNADASVSSLARIMAGDQALAAMVLKLANSAYYGYARKIESLPDAVVLLGFASVKNLAITASITRLLTSDRDEYAGIRSDLFDHSLATAVGARILGRTKRISGEKAFVAGLLHDLGLIVLVCYRKPLFGELMRAAESHEPVVRRRRARGLRLRARRARLADRGGVEVPARPLRGAALPPPSGGRRHRSGPRPLDPLRRLGRQPHGHRPRLARCAGVARGGVARRVPDRPALDRLAGVGDPRRVPRGLVAQGRLVPIAAPSAGRSLP